MKSGIIGTLLASSIIVGCSSGETSKVPNGYIITMGNVGKIVFDATDNKGRVACEKGINKFPSTDNMSEMITSSLQINKPMLKNGPLRLSRTNDGKYTTIRDSKGELVFRIINNEGNGTRALHDKKDLDTAIENCINSGGGTPR